jgi:hypothetical protein
MPDTRRKTPVTQKRKDIANVHEIAVRATEHAAAHGRNVTLKDVARAHRQVMSSFYKNKAVPGGDLPPATDGNDLAERKKYLRSVGPVSSRDAFNNKMGGRRRTRRRSTYR